jgi:UDP-glucose 4-epimerase
MQEFIWRRLNMEILITGGTGYIGSHIAVELLIAGYSVIIADNFCNSTPNVTKQIEKITGQTLISTESGTETRFRENYYTTNF